MPNRTPSIGIVALSLAALVLSIAIAGALLWHDRVDEEVRRRAEDCLSAAFPGLEVRVRSAAIVEGRGIEVRGVSLTHHGMQGPGSEALYVDEAFVQCDTDPRRLWNGTICVTGFTIRRPTLRWTTGGDGPPRLSDLPVPDRLSALPAGSVENGTIEVIDLSKSPPSVLVFHDVQLTLETARDADASGLAPGSLLMKGRCSMEDLERANWQCSIGPDGRNLSVLASLKGLNLGAGVLDDAPGWLTGEAGLLRSLRARVDVEIRAGRPWPGGDWVIAAAADVQRGRFDDPRLPFPLDNVTGRLTADRNGIELTQASGNNGPTRISASGRIQGFSADSPRSIQIVCQNLSLDERLTAHLPPTWRSEWLKYSPSGFADVQLTLQGQGEALTADVRARLIDVSILPQAFPYRLDHCQGNASLAGARLHVDMTCHGGIKPIRINGDYRRVEGQWVGHMEAVTEGLPIDRRLIGAFPASTQEVLNSLAPSGECSVLYRQWKEPGDEPAHEATTIHLIGCQMRYRALPYPLSNVCGEVQVADGSWTFKGLTASNDTARVACDGHYRPADGGSQLWLSIRGVSVPLEEELRDALPAAVGDVWRELQPSGTVRFESEVRHTSSTGQTEVWTRVDPEEETVSIEPLTFPYRLEGLKGGVVYDRGLVVLDDLSGRHGSVELLVRGTCRAGAEGGWVLNFERLAADRLRLDAELLRALPVQVAGPLAACQIEGPLAIDGTVEFVSERPGEPIRAGWNVNVDLFQNRIGGESGLDHLHGTVGLRGRWDEGGFSTAGELAIESLTYQGQQFTEVLGPLLITDHQALFGAEAARPWSPADAPRPVTGRFHGGRVSTNASLKWNDRTSFRLHAELMDADLADWSRDLLSQPRPLTGKVFGVLDLSGDFASTHTLSGEGWVELREADLYELPVMVQLLRMLSLKRPDVSAFSRSDALFRIRGPHVYLSEVNLRGDMMRLRGEGEVGLNGDLHLAFEAALGQNERRIPLVREILGEASRQTLTIEVLGTVESPVIRKKALPGVKRVLEGIESEMLGRRPDGQ